MTLAARITKKVLDGTNDKTDTPGQFKLILGNFWVIETEALLADTNVSTDFSSGGYQTSKQFKWTTSFRVLREHLPVRLR